MIPHYTISKALNGWLTIVTAPNSQCDDTLSYSCSANHHNQYKRLTTHIISTIIFTNSQFCFRKKSPTDKAAYKLINDILIALSNKRIVGGIFLELERL